ncbi:MAG: heme A synthase [Firmicutes bacterium]|nr:heme A synthase [Bacillota bacterium]
MSRGLKGLAWLAVGSMFAVLMAGALVTKTGSGEGCGASWPLCEGQWLPLSNQASIIEYSHRAISGVAGIAVLALSVILVRSYGWRPELRWLAGVSVFFLLLQSALGAWVVLAPQPDWMLALHFGISLAAFAGVLLAAVMLHQLHGAGTGRERPVSPRLRSWAWFSLVFVYLVVYSGAYVRHTNSNLACPDWPLCGGQLIPELTGPVAIQFAHRLAAALAVVVLAGLVRAAASERHERPDVYRASLVSLGLVLAQALTGGLSVLTRLSLLVMMLHSAIITVLFGVLAYACLQVMPEPAPAGAERDRRLAVSVR